MENDCSSIEKENIISQLENLIGTRPLFYLKFCSQEKYAQDVCNGDLYGNTAEYFRKEELESGIRGQGDRFEMILPIKTTDVSVYDIETGNLIALFEGGNAMLQINDDDLFPIVCFVGITLREMELIEADESHAVFQLPFSDEEYQKMEQNFGSYCVIIGANELEHHINSFCRDNECDYIFDAVDYCRENRIERMLAYAKRSKNRFLYKNNDLRYQREYRLAVAIEMPDDHFLRFGKLKTAKILPSKLLQDEVFSIKYISHAKENVNGTEKTD